MRYICARIGVFAFSAATSPASRLCAWLRPVTGKHKKGQSVLIDYPLKFWGKEKIKLSVHLNLQVYIRNRQEQELIFLSVHQSNNA